ncbi:MAG: transposase, partial [Thermoproteus sp.]|nr:transposase [Thermoproteus sp.]
VKVDDKVYIVEHNIGRIVIGYSAYRQIAQAVRGNRHVSRTVSKGEKNKKKDRRRKIARLIVREAKRRSCAIAVEDLPKNVPSHMIERIEDKRLGNRIYQAGFIAVLREIEDEAKREGVKLIKVDPSRTSSLCPRCGGGLVRGSASRELRCPRCGFRGNRDAIAVINIEGRARQGPAPSGPMPDDPAPEAVVLPMKAWARRKSLEDALRH